MTRHKSDPGTGRATVPLPRLPRRRSHHRPNRTILNPGEGEYHRRAKTDGYVAGRRIA